MEEFQSYNPGIPVNLEWRKGRLGDWVLGDDGSVMQVLKVGSVSSTSPRDFIRTPAGTFVLIPKTRLDSVFRENIYSFGGHRTSPKTSKREQAFVSFILLGYEPVMAYLKAFRTNNELYAKQHAYLLLGKERIMTAIKESIKQAGEDTGATLEWAMESIKKTVDDSKSESIKLKGADMIAEYHGAKNKETGGPDVGLIGAFKGFSELPETRQIEE